GGELDGGVGAVVVEEGRRRAADDESAAVEVDQERQLRFRIGIGNLIREEEAEEGLFRFVDLDVFGEDGLGRVDGWVGSGLSGVGSG
ncbi:hypothetical protein LINPERPRIM_LOCUS12786, partial [Linum perenne]